MSTTPIKKSFDALFGTDQQAEQDGAWAMLRGGMEVKVRSDNAHIVRDFARDLDKKFRAIMLAHDGLPPKYQDEYNTELVIGVILVDWRNHPDGTTYSKAAAKEFVTKYPRFRQEVQFLARQEETFKPAELAVMEGNSLPSSDTSTS
jgi:hypothetical protein